jgi:hypothetical protein
MRVMRRILLSLVLFLLSLSRTSHALDFEGWPSFDPLAETKNSETKPQTAREQEEPITWQPWKDMRSYRYRIGCREIGSAKWERYVAFESRENIRIAEISYGSLKAPDIMLSPSNPVGQIVLQSPSASKWKWNASSNPTAQDASISVR